MQSGVASSLLVPSVLQVKHLVAFNSHVKHFNNKHFSQFFLLGFKYAPSAHVMQLLLLGPEQVTHPGWHS